jgi:cytochrome d ubiquinol oxidase subunit II
VATIWFILLAFMLTTYVVLDGFDLGAGILHLWIARDDRERRTVLAAIGPVWDGNEVWLIAAGGLLVFAFPPVYAAAFSGFYLPLMLALWLLVLRGLSIELRSHHIDALWRQFFDVVFAGASALLAVIFGVALGDVLRGVALDGDGFFDSALFTNFRQDGELGAIDWYSVSVGVYALLVLAAHGATYLRWKTSGELSDRAAGLARRLWWLAAPLTGVLTVEAAVVRPALLTHLAARPALWVLPLLGIAGFIGVLSSRAERHALRGFLGSALMLAALLGLCAGGLYPQLLPAVGGPGLDVHNAANDRASLAVGLAWWIPATVLALGYVAYVFLAFRGKAVPGPDEHA